LESLKALNIYFIKGIKAMMSGFLDSLRPKRFTKKDVALKDVLTLKESSRLLNIDTELILQGIGQGSIRAKRIERQWYFEKQELQVWHYYRFVEHHELQNKAPYDGQSMSLDELLNAYRMGEREFQGHDLAQINFSNQMLEDIDFAKAQLGGTSFEGSTLTNADFYEAFLRKASFKDADLTRADLRRTDLSFADMSGTILIDADLTGANLTGVKFSGAKIQDAFFWDGVYLTNKIH
jgi:hypothetical protein